uniref:Prostaglandin F2 receptor negative regulator-like n=1 Tax=Neolamprologus brichardi TaxID=32507 RepID=A0A3Q4I674_NEOBR
KCFLVCGCSARVVTVPPGPLIRVEGQPVSIRCDVKEYTGPSEQFSLISHSHRLCSSLFLQDFEWNMLKDAKGQKTKIISSFDSRYSDQMYSKRVASGDISMVRLQDNEVELKIAEVKLTDAGFYECQTPSTDYVISGNYMAQVQLTVIPNTLKVSPKTPLPVISEGSDLTLSCNVTRELIHPTYLSVTWSVKKGTTSEEILTFGPQGDVVTGSRFARRYADGGIRLVPGRNGVFELVISRMTTSDEGNYECNGTEWTHESGGNWIKIAESTKEMGTVAVTPTGKSCTVLRRCCVPLSISHYTVHASIHTPSLLIIPTFTLRGFLFFVFLTFIILSHLFIPGFSLHLSDFEARLGARGKTGEASLERTETGDYRLGVRGVTIENGGNYTCRVRAFINKEGRRWYMTAEKTSNPVTVKVSEMRECFPQCSSSLLPRYTTAEPTELACRVTNIANLPLGGRLGVSWEHTSLPGDDPQTSHPIGSLDANGNLLPGSIYMERMKSGALTLSRVQPNTFKLRILRTQVQFFMLCSPIVNVVAKRIREASVGGSTFELGCSVTTQNIGDAGYSVLIQSQDSLDSTVRTIMTLSPDNVVQHGGATDPNRRDNLVLTKSGAAEFRFRLAGVQLSDRGYYWCDVTAWTKQQPGQAWTKASSSESNKIRINFLENGPSFSIAIKSDDSSVYPWETAKMECSLSVSGSSPKTDDLAYEVKWFFTRLRGGPAAVQVASVDRFGVVRKINRNSSSDVTIERKDTHTYLLNIFGTQDRLCCCRNTAHLPRSRNKLMDLEMD